MKNPLLYSCLFFACIALGCNSAPSSTDTTGTAANTPATTAPGEPSSTVKTVAYSKVQEALDAACIKCHGANKNRPPAAAINLTSFAMLQKNSGLVIANDPDNSLLYQAVMGTHGEKKMPLGGGTFSAEQIATIHDWIKSGAKGS